MSDRSFASDNNSGVHPAIMQALADANTGHCVAYGDDPHTRAARETFKRIFGDSAEVFFTYNGTGANVTALSTLTRSWQAVICSASAHINVDECGAPEKLTGCKLYAETPDNGKITPAAIDRHLHCFGFEHHNQPGIVSITQATELGTVYELDEVKAITAHAHKHGLPVHMDGARIANAAAALGCGLRELTTDAGIDVLSFGGTKNGLMFGEAVVFLTDQGPDIFKYVRKQAMQLHSKMRFIAAQYNALLEGDLWLENATHSNAMGALLAAKAAMVPGVTITRPVETNGVFARIPREAIEPLRKEHFFYTWDEENDEVRWMASFDTTEDDVNAFVDTLSRVLGAL